MFDELSADKQQQEAQFHERFLFASKSLLEGAARHQRDRCVGATPKLRLPLMTDVSPWHHSRDNCRL